MEKLRETKSGGYSLIEITTDYGKTWKQIGELEESIAEKIVNNFNFCQDIKDHRTGCFKCVFK
jgi:hypothetical protein